MMYKHPKITVNTMGPLSTLWLIIITLKLMAIIHWSWWVVVCFPVIVVLAILLGFGAFCFLGAVIWQLWEICTTSDAQQSQRKAKH